MYLPLFSDVGSSNLLSNFPPHPTASFAGPTNPTAVDSERRPPLGELGGGATAAAAPHAAAPEPAARDQVRLDGELQQLQVLISPTPASPSKLPQPPQAALPSPSDASGSSDRSLPSIDIRLHPAPPTTSPEDRIPRDRITPHASSKMAPVSLGLCSHYRRRSFGFMFGHPRRGAQKALRRRRRRLRWTP